MKKELTRRQISKMTTDIVVKDKNCIFIRSENEVERALNYFVSAFPEKLDQLLDNTDFSDNNIKETLHEEINNLYKEFNKREYVVHDKNGDVVNSTDDASVCYLANLEIQSCNSTKNDGCERLAEFMLRLQNTDFDDLDKHEIRVLKELKGYTFDYSYEFGLLPNLKELTNLLDQLK